METYIVRQPILRADKEVVAYELVYRHDASSLFNDKDYSSANAIIEFFSDMDADSFVSSKDVYLTFTPNLLLRDIPKLFDPKRLVMQVEETVLMHPDARDALVKYREMGYRTALIGFVYSKKILDLLYLIDMIKLDFSEPNLNEYTGLIGVAHGLGKEVIAYNVNNPALLQIAFEIGIDRMQGSGVAEMVRTEIKKADHLESNFLRLLAAITKAEPDFDEIAKIISLDVTLTFSLMRIVNSAYFGLKNRVNDVTQALTMIGLTQLKQWVYLMSFANKGSVSDELIKTSFQRGTLCEELAKNSKNFPLNASEAYLLGMFSTLDVLLEVNMASAIEKLPLSDELKAGLLGEPSAAFTMLCLCYAYEKGDWSELGQIAHMLGIPLDVVGDSYIKSIRTVGEVWKTLMR